MSILFATLTLLAGVLYALFGGFVFVKLRGRPNRWVYISWTVTSVVWFISAAGLYLHLGLQAAILCSKITYTGIVFIPIMMLHFCSTFLVGDKTSRWIWAGYGLATIFAVTVWIDGVFLNGCYVRSWGYFPRASWMHAVFVFSVMAQTNYFFFRVTRTLNDPTLSATKREQVRYIRRGLLWYAASSLDFLPNYGIPTIPIGSVLSVIGLGHIAYAVLRHQLLDIQIIVRRTLVYSIASTIATMLNVAILLVTVDLLRPLFGGKSWESVIIACIISAFCHPLIRRIQRPIDHMLGRSQLDHGIELMKFSTDLSQDQSVERARNLLGHIIEEAFRPTGFVVYCKSAKGFELFVQSDLPAAPKILAFDHLWAKRFEQHAEAQVTSGSVLSSDEAPDKVFAVRAAAPLINQKHLQGFILVGGKRSEEPYTEQDLILMKIVANQAAGALERPHLIKEVGSGFAHEIKTPLSNIAMPAELCVLDLQELIAKDYAHVSECVPVVMRRLEYIVDQAIFASHRVDAMQQLSEAASLARLTNIELHALVTEVVDSLAAAALNAGTQLSVEVPDEFTIAGDKQQLEILIANLIKNAIEAVSASSAREVMVRIRRKSERVLLEVEDSGPGIRDGDRARAFEPHFSTKSGNTRGMGLYIARRIANAHHGVLAYERRGHRTVMRVTFPSAVLNPTVEQPA